MTNQRMETLRAMVKQNPQDGFARYGLAMEYVKAGDFEAAVKEFQDLLEVNSRYAAAYYHSAQTYEKLGRLDEARQMYRRGIAVTAETGDAHTRSELEAALELLG